MPSPTDVDLNTRAPELICPCCGNDITRKRPGSTPKSLLIFCRGCVADSLRAPGNPKQPTVKQRYDACISRSLEARADDPTRFEGVPDVPPMGSIRSRIPATGERVERAKRIAYLLNLRATGTSKEDAIAQCAEEWNLSPLTVNQGYWFATDKRIREHLEESSEDALGRHFELRSMLLKKALKKGNLKIALDVVKDDAKLRALYAQDKLAASATQVVDDRLAAMLANAFGSVED